MTASTYLLYHISFLEVFNKFLSDQNSHHQFFRVDKGLFPRTESDLFAVARSVNQDMELLPKPLDIAASQKFRQSETRDLHGIALQPAAE